MPYYYSEYQNCQDPLRCFGPLGRTSGNAINFHVPSQNFSAGDLTFIILMLFLGFELFSRICDAVIAYYWSWRNWFDDVTAHFEDGCHSLAAINHNMIVLNDQLETINNTALRTRASVNKKLNALNQRLEPLDYLLPRDPRDPRDSKEVTSDRTYLDSIGSWALGVMTPGLIESLWGIGSSLWRIYGSTGRNSASSPCTFDLANSKILEDLLKGFGQQDTTRDNNSDESTQDENSRSSDDTNSQAYPLNDDELKSQTTKIRIRIRKVRKVVPKNDALVYFSEKVLPELLHTVRWVAPYDYLSGPDDVPNFGEDWNDLIETIAAGSRPTSEIWARLAANGFGYLLPDDHVDLDEETCTTESTSSEDPLAETIVDYQ